MSYARAFGPKLETLEETYMQEGQFIDRVRAIPVPPDLGIRTAAVEVMLSETLHLRQEGGIIARGIGRAVQQVGHAATWCSNSSRCRERINVPLVRVHGLRRIFAQFS